MTERNIENSINETLFGNARKHALDFVAFLHANEMLCERGTGYWVDKHYWMIKHKGEYVCFILFNGYGEKAHKDEPAGWIIWSDDSASNSFEDYPLDEHMKKTAWQNVDFCASCGSCGGGTRKTIFNKQFDGVCRTTFRFNNPDAETVEFVKKLVEIRKINIDAKW